MTLNLLATLIMARFVCTFITKVGWICLLHFLLCKFSADFLGSQVNTGGDESHYESSQITAIVGDRFSYSFVGHC